MPKINNISPLMPQKHRVNKAKSGSEFKKNENIHHFSSNPFAYQNSLASENIAFLANKNTGKDNDYIQSKDYMQSLYSSILDYKIEPIKQQNDFNANNSRLYTSVIERTSSNNSAASGLNLDQDAATEAIDSNVITRDKFINATGLKGWNRAVANKLFERMPENYSLNTKEALSLIIPANLENVRKRNMLEMQEFADFNAVDILDVSSLDDEFYDIFMERQLYEIKDVSGKELATSVLYLDDNQWETVKKYNMLTESFGRENKLGSIDLAYLTRYFEEPVIQEIITTGELADKSLIGRELSGEEFIILEKANPHNIIKRGLFTNSFDRDTPLSAREIISYSHANDQTWNEIINRELLSSKYGKDTYFSLDDINIMLQADDYKSIKQLMESSDVELYQIANPANKFPIDAFLVDNFKRRGLLQSEFEGKNLGFNTRGNLADLDDFRFEQAKKLIHREDFNHLIFQDFIHKMPMQGWKNIEKRNLLTSDFERQKPFSISDIYNLGRFSDTQWESIKPYISNNFKRNNPLSPKEMLQITALDAENFERLIDKNLLSIKGIDGENIKVDEAIELLELDDTTIENIYKRNLASLGFKDGKSLSGDSLRMLAELSDEEFASFNNKGLFSIWENDFSYNKLVSFNPLRELSYITLDNLKEIQHMLGKLSTSALYEYSTGKSDIDDLEENIQMNYFSSLGFNKDVLKDMLQYDTFYPEHYSYDKRTLYRDYKGYIDNSYNLEGQNLNMLLRLVEDGIVPKNIARNITSNGKMKQNVVDDIEKLYLASINNISIVDAFVPVVKNEADLEKIGPSEVYRVPDNNQTIRVKLPDGNSKELDLSAEKFVELFPPVERYSIMQGGAGDCFLLTSINLINDNPNTRYMLYDIFNESAGDITTAKFPNIDTTLTDVDQALADVQLANFANKNFKAIQAIELLYGRSQQDYYVESYFKSSIKPNLSLLQQQLNIAKYNKGKILIDGEIIKQKDIEAQINELLDEASDLASGKTIYADGEIMSVTEAIRRVNDFSESHYTTAEEYYRAFGGTAAMVMPLLGMENVAKLTPVDFVNNIESFIGDEFLIYSGTNQSKAGMESELDIENNIVSSHAYSIYVRQEEGNDPQIIAINPWNSSHEIILNKEQFLKHFRHLQVVKLNQQGV